MRKLILILFCCVLSACGTLGIGSNHTVNIHNSSEDTIYATGQMGRISIKPGTSFPVESKDAIQLSSSNDKCDVLMVQTKPNAPAIILDVVPGLFFGIIPILVDAVTGNLYRLPSSYVYGC